MPNKNKSIVIKDGSRSTKITDPSEILANLIDSIPAFVWTVGINGECTYFNRAWLDYRGQTLEKELINGFTHGIHPDDQAQTVARFNKAYAARSLYETEYRIKNANDEYHWVLDRGMPVYREADGGFLGYSGTCTNIDSKKQLEKELGASQNVLSNQFENLKLIHQLSTQLHESLSVEHIVHETLNTLAAFNQNARIAMYFNLGTKEDPLIMSRGFEAQYQALLSKIPMLWGTQIPNGGNTGVFLNEDSDQEKGFDNEAKNALAQLKVASGAAIPLIYQNKNLGWINIGFHCKRNFSQVEIDTLESIGKTVSLALSNARSRIELEFRAEHDALTNLPNRSLLHKKFEEFVTNEKDESAALLLMDLDRFKEINDTLGHDIGDLVLKKIGPQLSSLLARYKTELVRLGGDEFAIVLYRTSDQDKIFEFANTLLDTIRQPVTVQGMRLEIDASIGIALYPQDGKTSHALLRSADVAMYESKRKSSLVTLYDASIDTHSYERLSLITELRNAIRKQQLKLHYQPKLDLATQSIIGYEALLRWYHPSQGLLYPESFIHLAEVSDAIHLLTETVMEMAMAQQAQWHKQGHDCGIAINISARNLVDDRCVRKLKALLEQYDTSPEKVELEITETALMHDPDGAVRLLNQISDIGVKLSIDDFGTGYSSLAYLRNLPIDALKIDSIFVKNMLGDTQDTAIVRSTISLAHNLNLKVIAEGVEDKATLQSLTEMGCDLAQGYYISKPLLGADIDQS